jgi:hypothetical protein
MGRIARQAGIGQMPKAGIDYSLFCSVNGETGKKSV